MSKLSLDQAVQVYGRLGVAATTKQLDADNLRGKARSAVEAATTMQGAALDAAVDVAVSSVPKRWYTGAPDRNEVGWEFLQLVGESFGSYDRAVERAVLDAVGKHLDALKALPMAALDAFLAKATAAPVIDTPRAQAVGGYMLKIQAGTDTLGLLTSVHVPAAVQHRLHLQPSSNDRLADDGWTQLDTLDYAVRNLVTRDLADALGLTSGVAPGTLVWTRSMPAEQRWIHEAEEIVSRWAAEASASGAKPDEDLAFILADSGVREFLHRLYERRSDFQELFPKLADQIAQLAPYSAKAFSAHQG